MALLSADSHLVNDRPPFVISTNIQHTAKRLQSIPHFRLSEMRDLCKALLGEILEGKVTANFYEGMGCPGGCVGGPKALIPLRQAASHVDSYGDRALFQTPLDNPHVVELLRRLGIYTPKQLVENSKIFTRHFQP